MQNIDTLSKYGQSFQTKVLSSLITDVRLLDTLNEIIHPKFFEAESNKWIADEIKNYYNDFKKSPTLDVFKVEVSKLDDKGFQKTVIEQLKLVFTNIGDSDMDFVKKEFSSFCINQNLKQAIVESIDLLKAGNYDKIKDLVDKAMKVGIDNDLGHDYVLDFEERTTEINRNSVPTGWDCIDEIMDGGLGPGELGVAVAPSGVGKTWVLCALGAAAVKAGLNVVHYSLELSEHYVGQRYDTVFTQIPSSEVKENKEQVFSKINKLNGKLLIKYYPPKGVSAKKIEAHIEKMTAAGNKPDLVIIDYADLLLSHSNNSDSTYGEQGGIYIELRGMGGELGLPIWTASQTNRSAIDSEVIEADKIADSYAKVMNADFIMSISRKAKDKLNNTARFHVMKNRFGPDGITFPSKMDTNTGFIEVFDGNSSDGIITQKESANGQNMEQQLLHKKYVENFG
jgi:replicative DNA helicase|tara:strand:- start:449 stop:1807 length:1359 start_codon:yes stop_codon:yes gene_type:complete